LRQIVEFIRGGGMVVSREQEQHQLQFQRERLLAEQLQSQTHKSSRVTISIEGDQLEGISAARGLLKFLVD
jgi:hypothetical protein